VLAINECNEHNFSLEDMEANHFDLSSALLLAPPLFLGPVCM